MGAFKGAPCIGMDPAIFFPGKDTTVAEIVEREAICEDCPLSAFTACAAAAVENAEVSGIWAGMNIPQAGRNRARVRRRLEEISGKTWPKIRLAESSKARKAAITRMLNTGHTPKEISQRLGVDDRVVHRQKAAS